MSSVTARRCYSPAVVVCFEPIYQSGDSYVWREPHICQYFLYILLYLIKKEKKNNY